MIWSAWAGHVTLYFLKAVFSQILLGPYLDLNAGWFIYFLFQITCSIPKVYFSEMQQSLRREHIDVRIVIPLSANPTKWSKTLKQFVGKLPTNCLILLDHFVGLVIKAYFSRLRLNFSSPFIYISDNTIFE